MQKQTKTTPNTHAKKKIKKKTAKHSSEMNANIKSINNMTLASMINTIVVCSHMITAFVFCCKQDQLFVRFPILWTLSLVITCLTFVHNRHFVANLFSHVLSMFCVFVRVCVCVHPNKLAVKKN